MQQASFFPTEAHLANESKLRMALAVSAARHAVAQRTRPGKPGHIAQARMPPPTKEDSSCGVSADAPGPETLGRFVAPSVTVSTSTGSCSDSAQEDGSDALVSARSELASEDITPQVRAQEEKSQDVEAVPQQSNVSADQEGCAEEYPISGSALEVTPDSTNEQSKDDAKDDCPVPATSAETSNATCAMEEHANIQSFDSSFAHDEDCWVIDPEADEIGEVHEEDCRVIDPEADEIGQISKCEVSQEESRVVDSKADDLPQMTGGEVQTGQDDIRPDSRVDDSKADDLTEMRKSPKAKQSESNPANDQGQTKQDKSRTDAMVDDSNSHDLTQMSKTQIVQQDELKPAGGKFQTEQDNASCAPAEEESIGLNAVLGSWWDAKLSFYEVCFDKESNSSCYVKTTRPAGVVRETNGLIRMGQVRGKTLGRVIWGSAFILETPIKNPNRLQWRSIRGGKDFMWTRELEDEEDAEGGAEESWQIASPVEADQGSESQAPEPEMQPPITNEECTSFSEHWGKRSIQKRVWRAVDGKPLVAAKPGESSKTPSEVAAAPCRRTKGRNGAWRVLDKNRRT